MCHDSNFLVFFCVLKLNLYWANSSASGPRPGAARPAPDRAALGLLAGDQSMLRENPGPAPSDLELDDGSFSSLDSPEGDDPEYQADSDEEEDPGELIVQLFDQYCAIL